MTILLIIILSLVAGLWYVDSQYQKNQRKLLNNEINGLTKSNLRLREIITELHQIQPDEVSNYDGEE